MSTQNTGTAMKMIRISNEKPKRNLYELFEKVHNDLETSQIYMLKSINIKIDELEERLLKKFEEDLLENESTIMKIMEDGNHRPTHQK